MANDVRWPCSLRTKAKLEILRQYLGAWFGVLAAGGFREAVYLDGFCGPGEYLGGEIGSPLIALSHANAVADRFRGFRPTLIFVDRDENVLKHLSALVLQQERHSNVRIVFEQSNFASIAHSIFADNQIADSAPRFSFVDPFGFSQSPFDYLSALMPNKSSEIFVNFMCGWINRFKYHSSEEVRVQVREMIGIDNLDFIKETDDNISKLCELYAESLLRLGKYVRIFMIRDEGNVRDNALFFCGNNQRGFQKIKEAMWKLDPIYGNSFSAYKHVQEDMQPETLFGDEPQVSVLRRQILAEYGERDQVQAKEVIEWTSNDSDFLAKHARAVLEDLHDAGDISVRDPKPQKRKRRRGDWPGRLIVNFGKKDG